MAHSASENEGVRALLRELQKQVEMIDEVLLNSDSKDIDNYARDRIIDQKLVFKRIIGMFTNTEEQIGNFEKRLDEELNRNT